MIVSHAEGRQVKETIGREADGITRKHAEAALRERLVNVDKRGWRKPAPTTFSEYAEAWFERAKTTRGWKPGTVAATRTRLNHLNDEIGDRQVARIRPRDVAALIDKQLETFVAKTVNVHLNLLHDILKGAVADELIASNPVSGVERPKVKRNRWRILQPAEVPAVSKAFSDARARRVFLTFMLTGLRRSELRALRWGHVNLVDGTLRVVESKSEEGERSIALPSLLVDELIEHYKGSSYRTDSDYVFCHPKKGSAWCADWFRGEFDNALASAGITENIRIHDLRHAAPTNLAATGASPIALMATAGHRSMQTTKQYVHLAGVVFRDEADALSRRLLGVPETGTNTAQAVQPSHSG
jgi:integrase